MQKLSWFYRTHLQNVGPDVKSGKVLIGGVSSFCPTANIFTTSYPFPYHFPCLLCLPFTFPGIRSLAAPRGHCLLTTEDPGATLAKPLQDGQPPEMTGSVFITVADTHADVLAFLKDDIYATVGVWDLDKVQIIPFRTAVRKGLPDLGTGA